MALDGAHQMTWGMWAWLLGVNTAAVLLPLGALANLLWRRVLADDDVAVSWADHARLDHPGGGAGRGGGRRRAGPRTPRRGLTRRGPSGPLGSPIVLHLTLANLRAKPGRFVATMLAIVVGTGFLAGTLVLSDSLGPALESNAVVALKGVDAAVQPKLDTGGRRRGNQTLSTSSLPASLLATVTRARGVKAASGTLSAQLNVLGPDGTVPLKHANGSLWIDVAALSPYKIVSGRAPTAAGQIAIDQQTADAKHWGAGHPPRAGHVVGLAPSHRGRDHPLRPGAGVERQR